MAYSYAILAENMESDVIQLEHAITGILDIEWKKKTGSAQDRNTTQRRER